MGIAGSSSPGHPVSTPTQGTPGCHWSEVLGGLLWQGACLRHWGSHRQLCQAGLSTGSTGTPATVESLRRERNFWGQALSQTEQKH